MRSTLRYLVIPFVIALVATSASFFVGEFVVASVPGGRGFAGSATVSGFPIPFATFFPCCSLSGDTSTGFSISLDNTYFYQPLSFFADTAIWFAISIGIVATFSIKRLLIALPSGALATLATLLLTPLSFVSPTPGLETAVLSPMGFPYGYLTYYVVDFVGVSSRGYQFDLSPAIADYLLWTGITLVAWGATVSLGRIVHRGDEKGGDLLDGGVPIVNC